MSSVARNAACPCDSGKKFKNCCGTTEKQSSPLWGKMLAGVIGLVVLGGVATAVIKLTESNDGPEPWEYNAATNQHWNPLPEHQHWHDGPPPVDKLAAGAADPIGTPSAQPIQGGTPLPTLPPVEPAAAPAEGEPAAWQYDAEQDRHWNPETKSWGQGMPPLEAFTSDP